MARERDGERERVFSFEKKKHWMESRRSKSEFLTSRSEVESSSLKIFFAKQKRKGKAVSL